MRTSVLPPYPKRKSAYQIDEDTKEVKLRVRFWNSHKIRTFVVAITAFDRQPEPNRNMVRIEGYSGDHYRVIALVTTDEHHQQDLGYAEISEIRPR